MSKYCASIWELLKDKRVKIVFDSYEKARVHLEGKTIGIDAINQTVTEPGASWAVMRREFGKRVLGLTLCGAKLVAFIDGEFASPGAGKVKQVRERASAAGEAVPPNTASGGRGFPARHPRRRNGRGSLSVGLGPVWRRSPSAGRRRRLREYPREVPLRAGILLRVSLQVT